MVMIHDGNIDIFYLEIHCQGQDDQLDAGHGKHHGKNCLVAEDLPEFLLQYESQNLHDSRILKFFNAIPHRASVMITRMSVSFQTYAIPRPLSMIDLLLRKYQREGTRLERAWTTKGMFSRGNIKPV